jgi:DNA-binding MarR family transcriptional regulator
MPSSDPSPPTTSTLARVPRGPGKYEREKSVGFLLRRAYQRNMMLFQRFCIDPALTSVQLAALHVLSDNGPSSLTIVGRLAAMDPATTSGVIDRLRDRGLVSLSPDPTDRRKVMVELEDAGRRLVQGMIPILEEVADATMDRLSVAERVALVYLLEKISQPEDEGGTDT